MTRRKMHLSLAALSLAALAACQGADGSLAPDPGAPALARSAAAGGYIVVFDDATTDAPGLARRLAAQHGATLRFTYVNAIKGMAVANLSDAAAEALARNPNVRYVEPDAPAQLFATQSNATWGIDRIDQRDTPLSGTYVYNATGTGVNAYIFDTGINLAHADFGGRASYVPAGTNGDFVGDGRGSASDCHGHGTHVAGTIGGTTWGVAKLVKLWAARVVNCQGSGDVSMAIAAVDWCTVSCARPAVVNMSLGYGDVQSLRTAVENSIAAGVNYAVAAGNGNFLGTPQDACLQSPAGAPNAVTVGATTSSDAESSFSNYGTCVDILAPGSSITSANYSSTTGSTSMSGTSMATPHVAGAIALFLEGSPSASPAQVTSALKTNGTPNTITLHSRSTTYGTPNLFLYTGAFGGGVVEPPPPPPPPADVITLSVSGTKGKNGRATANLSWSGSSASSIDVFRNGTRVTTTANDGAHADNLGRVSGTFTYRVCNAGTSTCSNDASVTF
jgi:subtilisin family serine protease